MRSHRRERKSIRKQLLLFGVAMLVSLLLVEGGLRAFFAVRIGPRVLLYGTSFHRNKVETNIEEGRTVKAHQNTGAGYTKYFPNEAKTDRDPRTSESFSVTINANGFRGPDTAREKPPGVIRVVTLGASSTFGYYNRDDETFPYLLEQRLNASPGRRFEVVNLGIPHLSSAQIQSLFFAEALPLDPDVVTFYEGRNDSTQGVWAAPDKTQKAKAATGGEEQGIRVRLKRIAWLKAAYRGARERLMMLALIDSLFLESEVLWFDEAYLASHLEGKTERFVVPVATIQQVCEERGILFIALNQQARSINPLSDTLHGRDPIKDVRSLTYADEVAIIQEKLDRDGRISYNELAFLTHDRLSRALEDWAIASGVPFVDMIEALDHDRDVLVTYVHLSPRGNQMIADILAEAIRGELLLRPGAAEALVSAHQ